jgi:predicted porin
MATALASRSTNPNFYITGDIPLKTNKLKAVIAAAALCASTAWAQSSVTIYGLIDQAIGKNIGTPGIGIRDSSGSRLGFSGQEDLGGGMKTFFVLETRFSPDTGVGSTPLFQGGSWVGVSGDWGKVTLGRQWSVAFLKTQLPSDSFEMDTISGVNYGTVGCGGAGGCTSGFWMDNAVTYEHSVGAFSFGVQAGVDKPTAAGSSRPFSLGVSYGDGPWYLAYGYEAHNSASGAGGQAKWHQATANYDFGPAKLITGFGAGEDNAGAKRRNMVLGVAVPVGGAGKVTGQINRHTESGDAVVSQLGLGYQYTLSKRTTLYTTVARDSKSTSKMGYDLGIRHTF